MKFKGVLSDRGLRVLEKGFLPTLEKLGKRCQVLLSPEDVHLIQAVTDTDGLQVTARLAKVCRQGARGRGVGAASTPHNACGACPGAMAAASAAAALWAAPPAAAQHPPLPVQSRTRPLP